MGLEGLHAAVGNPNELKFNVVRSSVANVSKSVYAVYQGRLIESFLEHFDKSFSGATATALATFGDLVS